MKTPCGICCHETRNAMAAVVYFAKHVRLENPTMASALLDAAIVRLDEHQKACAGTFDEDEDE